MATSGVYNGHPWRYSQPVIDSMAQFAARGGVAYGLGDSAHWTGSGDHISINNDHPGWITAVDLMSKSGLFSAPDFFHNFLVPAVAAEFSGGPVLYPELKYAISDYELRDRRPAYDWRKQSGGDGPDHVHLSFTNNFTAHTNVVDEYFAWLADGRKPVVAWLIGYRADPTKESEADMSMVTLSKGRIATVVRGLDKRIYRLLTDVAGKVVDDWQLVGNMPVASGVDACTRFGDDLWAVALDPKDDSVLVFSTPDVEGGSGLQVQDIGGAGIGGAPGITASGNNILVTVAGTYPRPGTVYMNVWNGAGWSGWKLTSGTAA